jgi:hypothetical protein
MHDVNKFLEEYDQAVIASDIVKIASNFHDQFVLSTPTEVWHLTNNNEFRSNLLTVFSGYRQLGAKECRMLTTKIIHFKSSHYIANIEWGLIDHKDKPIVKFDISYCIKKMGDLWRFIFVIDHNEKNRIDLYREYKFQQKNSNFSQDKITD